MDLVALVMLEYEPVEVVARVHWYVHDVTAPPVAAEVSAVNVALSTRDPVILTAATGGAGTTGAPTLVLTDAFNAASKMLVLLALNFGPYIPLVAGVYL